ncbi:hypothetical protein [Streptomyces genisteinicus]|uniref:Secreted protein n=1 Tax=Streptomyces genisteinicus TaxID=2768068 RepID=A0A7H0HPW6_9ACTN|nr:hypothetical protein [Streptomyces genisteinicus]QNP62582.1 hypothetical protein IAG43_06275 [Streptomyces genisteinicus]
MPTMTRPNRKRYGRKTTRNTLVVAAAAASALVLAAPTAGAAGVPGGGGSATWYADGDKMRICDTAADGKSVVVIASFTNTWKWHTSGAGGCTDRSYGNLPEGFAFSFRVCLGDFSEQYYLPATCSASAPAWA